MALKKVLYVIGCGGVGSALIPPLLRWNSFEKAYSEVHLIDGDTVEIGNLERQNFSEMDLAINKAMSLKENSLYGGFEVHTHEEYVNSDILLKKMDTSVENHIVMGVDNLKSRKEINDAFNKLDNAVLISCGNEYSDGNVQMAIRKDGKATTPDITCCHPELEDPQDKSPLDRGCDEIIESSPQLIFANLTAATIALNVIYGIHVGKMIPVRDIYFDVPTASFAHAEFPEEEEVKEPEKLAANESS